MQSVSRKKVSPLQTHVPNVDASIPSKLTRYTYHLYNIAHIKTIFQNPFVLLQTTRSFLVNRNGTYQSYQPPVEQHQQDLSSAPSSVTRGQPQQPLIRPQEYRTVLRVGSNQHQPAAKQTPFTIEWTPDIYPLSKLGELGIKLEYDHIHNGQLVKNAAVKEVILPHNSTSNSNVSTATLIPGTIYLANTSCAASNILTTSSSSVVSPSVKVATSKTVPQPIAPKITFLSPFQDSMDDVTANTLELSLPHETLVDTEGYTTLLF